MRPAPKRNVPPGTPTPGPAEQGPLGLLPPWLVTLVRPAALTVLIGCLMLPLTQVLGSVLVGLRAWLLLGAVLAAALETHYTHYFIRARYISGAEIWRLRAIEFGFYFIAIKLVQLTLGGAPAGGWPTDPLALLTVLLDLEAILALLLAVGVALIVDDTLEDLDRVGEPPDHDRQYVSPLDALTERFFVGGALVLVFSGLARVGLQDLLNFERPPVTGLVITVLVYFGVGFLLLGQVRLALLATQWQVQGARVPPELGGRWVRYSVAFLALAALIAFALPTGYTAGALGWLGGLITVVLSVLWTLVAILAGICLLPLSYIMSLLNSGRTPQTQTQPFQFTPPVVPNDQPMPPWLEVVRTILVWGLIIGMVLYVVVNYVRERPGLLRAVRELAPLRRLRQLWAALRHRAAGLAAALQDNPLAAWLRERGAALRTAATPRRAFRLGGVSAREKVQYYYLSLLRRASERGYGRRPPQTPQEYRPTLAANLPEHTPEVRALTQAFEESRYSAHPVEPEQVRAVRTAWGRLRAALAQQKKPKQKE